MSDPRTGPRVVQLPRSHRLRRLEAIADVSTTAAVTAGVAGVAGPALGLVVGDDRLALVGVAVCGVLLLLATAVAVLASGAAQLRLGDLVLAAAAREAEAVPSEADRRRLRSDAGTALIAVCVVVALLGAIALIAVGSVMRTDPERFLAVLFLGAALVVALAAAGIVVGVRRNRRGDRIRTALQDRVEPTERALRRERAKSRTVAIGPDGRSRPTDARLAAELRGLSRTARVARVLAAAGTVVVAVALSFAIVADGAGPITVEAVIGAVTLLGLALIAVAVPIARRGAERTDARRRRLRDDWWPGDAEAAHAPRPAGD